MIPSLRYHVVNVGPSGSGKSYMMKQMGGNEYGIFNKSRFRFQSETNMTEAGLVGTIKSLPNGENTRVEGAAQENKKGFMLFEEFSALGDAMKQSFNSQLDTQILRILDDGNVNKKMANGRIEYETDVTLWGGIQPVRTDLSRGIGRRLAVILHTQKAEDNPRYIRSLMRSLNVRPDEPRLQHLRERIDLFTDSLGMIRKIEFDDSVSDFYIDIGTHVTNVQLYNKMFIGYTIARHGAEKNLIINDDDKTIIQHIVNQEKWRADVFCGADLYQMVEIIKDCAVQIEHDVYVVNKKTLIKHGGKHQMNAIQVNDKIREMAKLDLIEVKKDQIILRDEVVEREIEHVVNVKSKTVIDETCPNLSAFD